MITALSDDTMNGLFYQVLVAVQNKGQAVTVRGCETKELHPCLMELKNPLNRTLIYPKRGNNPFQSLAETIWVLAGRDDVAFLSKFLPRAADFSDDGIVWRGGYGPRLRRWEYQKDCGIHHVDQFQYVINQLQKDPCSRQAVMSIWDPAKECTVEKTKDYCCSNWLHFMIRDNKLDLTVAMRSNDVIWGWSSINVYEFTVIQEFIASCLGIEVGSYYHLSDSLHVYEKDYSKMSEQKLQELIKNFCILEWDKIPPFRFFKNINGISAIDNMNILTEDCKHLCQCIMNHIKFESSYIEGLIHTYNLLEMYDRETNDWDPQVERKGMPWASWDSVMSKIPFCDLKISMIYWYRKNVLKDKDGGLEMIKECIDKARC